MSFRSSVDVDTASLLLIDPTHLPRELVANLIGEDDENNPRGVIIPLDSDGTYTVYQDGPDGPIIID